MANNQEQFNLFHVAINSTKRDTLKKNRDAIRDKITNYFKKELSDEIAPIFREQGSYAMFTILNPIKDDSGLGAYDLDDGVVFQGKKKDDRKSINWYHEKISAAVDDHTDQDPIQELTEWFFCQCKNKSMLRRLVRYLKAWCEYISSDKGFKMPSGCILTMLAAKHYKDNDEQREDITLSKMLASMYDSLSVEGQFKCPRPTFPNGEDLFKGYSETRKNDFLRELKSFKEDAERAVNCTNQKVACEKWQKHFGPRFPCSTAKDEDEDAHQKGFAGSINNNSQFA